MQRLETVQVPDPQLRLSHTNFPPENEGDPSIGMVPGFAHSAEHLQGLACALQERGIGSVLLDLQSDHRGKVARNFIGLNDYQRGLGKLVDAIRSETNSRLVGLLGHSQGGMNVQEWLQSHPEEGLLAMYLAPIPLKGAKDAVVKLIMQDANLLQLFLRSFFSKRAMQLFSEVQIREFFFDEGTPDTLVSDARSKLRHTSFRVLQQLMFRPWLRPHLRESANPTLLVLCPGDALFPVEDYDDLPALRTNLTVATVERGGHDFFLREPEETADHIASFVHAHTGKGGGSQ